MAERPILFSGPMFRAILDGRKTQTRRVVNPQPQRTTNDWDEGAEAGERVIYRGWPCRLLESRGINKAAAGELTPKKYKCPYGQPGDRLWVRETWGVNGNHRDDVVYRASPDVHNPEQFPWRPSIHMPRWASRITLEITNIRVERVQEIDGADALAEGFEPEPIAQRIDAQLAKEWFIKLWDSINAKRGYGWEANPCVWVIEFKRV